MTVPGGIHFGNSTEDVIGIYGIPDYDHSVKNVVNYNSIAYYSSDKSTYIVFYTLENKVVCVEYASYWRLLQ